MTALALLLVFTAASIDEDPAFAEAQELYRELEFERATIRFQEAALSPGLSPDDRAKLFAWIGLCYAQLSDLDGARRALRDAVALNPEVQLPPDAPPKLQKMLDEVREANPPPVAVDSAADPPPDPVDAPVEGEPVTGLVLTGVGSAVLLAGGALVSLALVNVAVASDEQTKQIDVITARDTANALFWAGGLSALVGAGLTAGGVYALVAE